VQTVEYQMATPDDLDETTRLVEVCGRRAVTGIADVRDLPTMESAFERGVAELGRLDTVIAAPDLHPGVDVLHDRRDVVHDDRRQSERGVEDSRASFPQAVGSAAVPGRLPLSDAGVRWPGCRSQGTI
jgi:hypothetical protein